MFSKPLKKRQKTSVKGLFWKWNLISAFLHVRNKSDTERTILYEPKNLCKIQHKNVHKSQIVVFPDMAFCGEMPTVVNSFLSADDETENFDRKPHVARNLVARENVLARGNFHGFYRICCNQHTLSQTSSEHLACLIWDTREMDSDWFYPVMFVLRKSCDRHTDVLAMFGNYVTMCLQSSAPPHQLIKWRKNFPCNTYVPHLCTYFVRTSVLI